MKASINEAAARLMSRPQISTVEQLGFVTPDLNVHCIYKAGEFHIQGLASDGSLAIHTHARMPAPAVRQYKDAANKLEKLAAAS